jgi:uncharacterized repeat protein (TIGR03803 family)
LFSVPTSAQTLTPIVNFNGANGQNPEAALVQGTDGNFYGTTYYGGANNSCTNGCGTVFKITPLGKLTTLHSFDGTDGANPYGPLILGTNGNLYGTTYSGGAHDNCTLGAGCGTVFKITLGGNLTVLHSFDGTDGGIPIAGLIQAIDGNFYGTTSAGGTSDFGTVFKITSTGKLTTLHSFNGNDGEGPVGGLVQGTDGDFYDTAGSGGPNPCGFVGSCGTVFKITPAGTLTVLHNFDGTDGDTPFAGLIQAVDGNFYGTTYQGGTDDTCFGGGCGNIFEMTPAGKLTSLHSFDGTDGQYPSAVLAQATDGKFYGTTLLGGSKGDGTIFKITAGGTLTSLHSFCSKADCADGASPSALMQGTSGKFYATTYSGGTDSLGTVFSLSVGLGPFVTFLPAARPIGQTVAILGQGFTGATGVFFSGTRANFTVQSDTYLTATVPAGSSTGKITVTETNGTLTSNKIFRVTPQIFSFSPTSAPPGTTVVIIGNGFLGTTEVVFSCGKSATFTVDSASQITAFIPAGAMNGPINVVTPGGHAGSVESFTVTE